MQIAAVRLALTGPGAASAVRGAEAVRPTPTLARAPERVPPGVAPDGASPAAVLRLSQEAVNLARDSQATSEAAAAPEAADAPEATDAPRTADGAPSSAAASKPEPTPEERQELQQLQRRDREVRAHEQAHKSAGGAHAGSVHLEYSSGPDGKRYASSGEVSIDVSAVKGDPKATLRKMQIVQRAANAPAEPSGADRQVAAKAASVASQARAELATGAQPSEG
jgi:hypothetical protein